MLKIMKDIRQNQLRTRDNAEALFMVHNIQILALLLIPSTSGFLSDIIKAMIIFGNVQNPGYIVLINFTVLCLVLVSFIGSWINLAYLQTSKFSRLIAPLIIKFLGFFIKNFRYILAVPIVSINLKTFRLSDSEVELYFKILAGVNISISSCICLFDIYTNWSNRFFQNDYCNRRENSFLEFLMLICFLVTYHLFDEQIGIYLLIGMSSWSLLNLCLYQEFYNIQRTYTFFNIVNISVAMMVLFDFPLKSQKEQDEIIVISLIAYKLSFILVSGKLVSDKMCDCLNYWYLDKLSFIKPEFQQEILQENYNFQQKQREAHLTDIQQKLTMIEKTISNYEGHPESETKLMNSGNNKRTIANGIFLLAQVFMAHKIQKGETTTQEKVTKWALVWQKMNLLVIAHTMGCKNPSCKCKKNKLKYFKRNQTEWILRDIQKLILKAGTFSNSNFKLKILRTYMHVELNRKPLKGYHEIMRLKKSSLSTSDHLDINNLLSETRECFDQLFLKNQVSNNILPLFQVFQIGQIMQGIQIDIKECVNKNISFLDLFLHENVKISQILSVSGEIMKIKESIDQNFQNLFVNYPEVKQSIILSHLYYQYFQIYKSRQKEFRQITHEKSMTKRMFQKYDLDVFSEKNGVIYMDLSGEKGKIKKVTKVIGEFYDMKPQQMVQANIRDFMPKIYSVYHNRFLENFIEYGYINILKSKERLLFGRNKHKFIFPLNATLKTQHLFNDEFGVTGLISDHPTNSQFIMMSKSGTILEATSKIYGELFEITLNKDIDKINKFNLYKMIPQLVRLIKEHEFEKTSKVHESLLVHSNDPEVFYQKFRNKKVNDNNESSTSVTSSLSFASEGLSKDSSMQKSEMDMTTQYLSATFKHFLTDLPILKLCAMKIRYKISILKTNYFEIFLIEIMSYQEVLEPYLQILDIYRPILQEISRIDDVQQIETAFSNIVNIVNQKDPIKLQMDNKENKNYIEYSSQANLKHMLRHNQKESIDNDLQQNPLVAQKEINSEGSSVTDMAGGQLRKQTLINGFSSSNQKVQKRLTWMILLLSALLLGLIVGIFCIVVTDINKTQLEEKQNIYILNISKMFEFKMSAKQVDYFEENNSSSPVANISELAKKIIDQQFKNQIIAFSEIHDTVDSVLTEKINVTQNNQKQSAEISVFELLHQIEYIFSSNEEQGLKYLRNNYQTIHNVLKNKTLQRFDTFQHNMRLMQKKLLITISLYLFMVIVSGLSFILSLKHFRSKQKNILGILATNSYKQILKAKTKLGKIRNILKQHQHIERQLNEITAFEYDENFREKGHENQNLQRNSKIIFDDDGSKNLSNKSIAILFILFVLTFSFFSIFTIIFYETLISQIQKSNHVFKQFYQLVIKPPALLNICLSNANRIFNGEQIMQYADHLYHEISSNYFGFTDFISKLLPEEIILLEEEKVREIYGVDVCGIDQNFCSNDQQQLSMLIEYHILELRDKLQFLGPTKLEATQELTPDTITRWNHENQISNLLPWVFHIYFYANTQLKALQQEQKREISQIMKNCIIIFCAILPTYGLIVALISWKFIKHICEIIKQAETIFIHFPFHVLAQNTYLHSYFNQKTKAGN